jgi:hypothetical protein
MESDDIAEAYVQSLSAALGGQGSGSHVSGFSVASAPGDALLPGAGMYRVPMVPYGVAPGAAGLGAASGLHPGQVSIQQQMQMQAAALAPGGGGGAAAGTMMAAGVMLPAAGGMPGLAAAAVAGPPGAAHAAAGGGGGLSIVAGPSQPGSFVGSAGV